MKDYILTMDDRDGRWFLGRCGWIKIRERATLYTRREAFNLAKVHRRAMANLSHVTSVAFELMEGAPTPV